MIADVDDTAMDRGELGHTRAHVGIYVGVGIVLTMATIGAVVRTSATPSPERAVAGDWGSVAFVLVLAIPAVLALVGSHDRPWLLVAAGVVLVPMCFLSFSFLFFPLIVPSVLFLSDAITRPRPAPRRIAQCIGAVLSVVFVVAAVVSLFAHTDPVSWSTATQSGTASDVITRSEALTSIGFLVAAVAIAALTPRDGSPQ
jgi:hypothetical protein